MSRLKHLDMRYAGMMGAYNFIYMAFASYGTVYLLDNQFDEGEIGIIVAAANILAAFAQPWIAAKADESEEWTLKEFNVILTVPAIIILASLLLGNSTGWLLGAQFMLAYTLLFVVQPLLNATSMFFVNLGYPINFGVCRAIGSLFFAIGSSVLGYLTASFGMDAVIGFALFAFSAYTLILHVMPFQEAKANPKTHRSREAVKNASIMPTDISDAPTTQSFYKKYPKFMFILAGVTLFFIFHNIVNIYMFQIINSLGGGTRELGLAFALGALVEVPMMMSYNYFRRYITDAQGMMITAFGFLIKALVTLFAVSVAGIYLAQFLQMFAFGLYATVGVYYTNQMMQDEDKVKGQALLTTCHTVGGVVGSFLGGQIIKYLTIDVALYFSVFVTVIGVVCFWIALRDDLKEERLQTRTTEGI